MNPADSVSRRLNRMSWSAGAERAAVEAVIADWRAGNKAARPWNRDATLWTSFGIVKAAQARGDFDVLAERGRRALRVHLGSDVDAGLMRLFEAVERAMA